MHYCPSPPKPQDSGISSTGFVIPDPAEIAGLFSIPGQFVGSVPYGSGHINTTHAAIYKNDDDGTTRRYIFQRLNPTVFPSPVPLMENVERISSHLRQKLTAEGNNDIDRKVLTTMPSTDGRPYAFDANRHLWRVYSFIEGATGYDKISSLEQAYQAALAFGRFQSHLSDLPLPQLHETLPDFHHTPKRLEALFQAVDSDPLGRAAEMATEIDWVRERVKAASIITQALENGSLPVRVVHNDTKINNVLLDDSSGEGLCVIDLDTVMSGCALHDFGDMVRSATNIAAEDVPDPSHISCNLEIFKAITDGFLAAANDFLTPLEKKYLVLSARTITLELGSRFLSDYLLGDTYFKIKHPTHNRDRCRNQFALLRSMEIQAEEMEAIVASAIF